MTVAPSAVRERYLAFVEAGFDRDQALYLTGVVITTDALVLREGQRIRHSGWAEAYADTDDNRQPAHRG